MVSGGMLLLSHFAEHLHPIHGPSGCPRLPSTMNCGFHRRLWCFLSLQAKPDIQSQGAGKKPKNIFPASGSFWWLWASPSSYLHTSLPMPACILWVSLLIRTSAYYVRVHPNDSDCNLTIPAQSRFPQKAMLAYIFLGTPSHHQCREILSCYFERGCHLGHLPFYQE